MTASRQTTVTALLPAYRAATFIQATLDSLSAQTRPGFNVIISVDGADDDTHAVCLRHAATDARFRVIRQEQRLGWLGNQNFLLELAHADYVLHAFADDVLAPDFLAKLCDALDARPEVVLCYSDIRLTYVDGTVRHMSYAELDGIWSSAKRGYKLFRRTDPGWWIPVHGIFRLKEARKIEGWKTSAAGEFSADWPWLFHLSLLGEFARIPETLYYKFYKPVSVSRNWEFLTWQWRAVRRTVLRELWNAKIPFREKLRFVGLVIGDLIKNPRLISRVVTDLTRRHPARQD